jgi:hypothetical protein
MRLRGWARVENLFTCPADDVKSGRFDVARSDGGSTARLAAAFTIEPDPSAPPPALGPMPLHLGASSGESEVLFDLSRGRVQRATTTLVMPATMSLPAGAETKTVALRITGKVTLDVIEPATR